MISERAAEIFLEAQTLDPATRAEYVSNACAGDPALLEDVESMLDAANKSESYFEGLVGRVSLDALGEEAPLPDHKVFGAWRLLRRIGQGGMGAVYLAERADAQFEQQGALKVLPTGLDTDEARARFLVERQILARLVHDNIARLLDGGVTDDGLPYFVMDYVDGTPIDEYCDAHDLDIDQRLALVLDIADAVQFAHGRLVVHRDLKPSNVLVDRNGRVRLLDFGIAKMLDPDPARVHLTQVSRRPATPAFASPEMLNGDSVDVTTDVYSIGALLYVLLTGRPPLSFDGLGFSKLCEHAATAIPPPVSSQNPSVGSELDSIIAKALAKLPEERYASVTAVASDIRNYLHGLPVAARAPTALYRARKFAGRHRLGIAFTVFAAVALISIVALTVHSARVSDRQARQIALERDRAEQTKDFLVSIFESADPNVVPGEQTARAILEAGRIRIENELAGQPEIQADLLKAMGSVYQNWRLPEDGRAVLERELELREAVNGIESREYASALVELAFITDVAGDYARSIDYARRALAIYESIDNPMGQARAHERIGRVLHLEGKFEGAREHFDRGLALIRSEAGAESVEASYLTEHIANLLSQQGRYEQSLRAFEETLAQRRKHVTGDSSGISAIYLGMGSVLAKLDRLDEATDAYEQGLAMNERLFGPDNNYRSYFVNGLGRVAEARGDLETAVERFATARQLILREMPNSPNLAFATANLGRLNMKLGRYDAALPLYREAEAIFEAKLPQHPALGDIKWRLGRCLLEAGAYVEAEPLILAAIERLDRQWGPEHPASIDARAAAVLLYESLGEPARAAAYQQRRPNGLPE